jgi:hypothetical protein
MEDCRAASASRAFRPKWQALSRVSRRRPKLATHLGKRNFAGRDSKPPDARCFGRGRVLGKRPSIWACRIARAKPSTSRRPDSPSIRITSGSIFRAPSPKIPLGRFEQAKADAERAMRLTIGDKITHRFTGRTSPNSDVQRDPNGRLTSTPVVRSAERPFAGPLASEMFNSSGNRQPAMGAA